MEPISKDPTFSDRERMVKSVAQMIGNLSIGFTPLEFLSALSLVTAGIVHSRYPKSKHRDMAFKVGKDAVRFLKDFKP
jgi:hypothetical protein